MSKFPRYDIYPNMYASPAPYDASVCCDCGDKTGLTGSSWKNMYCIDCFTSEMDEHDNENIEVMYKGYVGILYP